MKNNDYKCMCCGLQGNEIVFGVDTRKKAIEISEIVICPSCGSMDVDVLVPVSGMLK
jgi:Zn finger protein HypA/HybF involved in hydrogenase expression